MRRIALCLLALAAFGIGADCGGDSGPPLSAEEFAKQANAICKDRDTKVAQEGKDILTKPNTPADEVTNFYVKRAIPNAREKLKEVGELRPPTKDKAKVKKMLSAGKKALDAAEEGLKKQGSAFQQGGSALYKELNSEFNKLGRELKLTDCAEPA
jgi:hypothetical protein